VSRKLPDFLEGYLAYTDNTEPPRSYHVWCALSVIAAALKRRVYIKWGHKLIYPNMYVVLIGPSGRCRKGTAMGIAEEIVRDAGIMVTGESVTREQLIRAMAESIDSFENPSTGEIEFHCSMYCMSQELSVFLGQGETRFLADLTDWYDCRKEWRYETKQSGKDHLTGVCFNLLGATAADWLQSILPEEAVGGGFTSRIIFVVEEKKGKIIPEYSVTKEQLELKSALVHDLQQILLMAGEMRFEEKARKAYEAWYLDQERKMDRGEMPIADPRFSGYCDRRATHVRKLAMVMSASRSNSMTVTLKDFERALACLLEIEPNMAKTFGGMGKAKYADATDKIIGILQERRSVRRSDLLRMFYRDVDSLGMDIIEKVLVDMNLIKVKIDPLNNETVYELR